MMQIISRRLSGVVRRAFQEATPLAELGEKIRLATTLFDADAELITTREINSAENRGVAAGFSTQQMEIRPGRARDFASLFNVSEKDRFTLEALLEITARKGPELLDHLLSLGPILATAAKTGRLGPQTRHQLNKVSLFLEALPAFYASSDLRRNDRFEIVELWRQEALRLPVRLGGIEPRIKLSHDGGETSQKLADPLLYTPAIAQILFEANWTKVVAKLKEPTTDASEESVNAYVSVAATNLLKYQKINDEKEHIAAGESGHQLIGLDNVACQRGAVERVGVEEILYDFSSTSIAIDYATMPGPSILRVALTMLHEGYTRAEVAKAIGTDSKHCLQKSRRVVQQMGPDQAKGLSEWLQSPDSGLGPYAIDLTSIIARLNSGRITKLDLPRGQRPDPTRANATGLVGGRRHIWMK